MLLLHPANCKKLKISEEVGQLLNLKSFLFEKKLSKIPSRYSKKKPVT